MAEPAPSGRQRGGAARPGPINPAMAGTARPPVMEAHGWLASATPPAGLPLLDVSQAAPADPPPLALRQALAEAIVRDPGVHLYGPDLGLPDLRGEIARQFSAAYGGAIRPDQVAITAGCNQAFAAALATLAGPGDEVILPVPWYFNHKMWLDMASVRTVPLATGAGLLPDPAAIRARITPATRAIVLVSPNNPGGVEYPPALIAEIRDLARAAGIALILDETYRDFHARPGAAHDLFAGDWDDTLIQLYSFSKAYRLTGHRVGAMLTSPARLAEVEKFIDCVTICPPQPGQHAALWGMRNLGQWLAGERAAILARRAALAETFAGLDGWRVTGLGAYFAYVEHPFDIASDALARRLIAEAGIMLLPGTMFAPAGDAQARRHLRIAFANIDAGGIAELAARLGRFRP